MIKKNKFIKHILLYTMINRKIYNIIRNNMFQQLNVIYVN